MCEIKLLDCTLRDGGYINDWNFGEEPIRDMIELLEKSKVDILELGFFKDEPYFPNRTVFNNAGQLAALIAPKKPGLMYTAMIEVVDPTPLDMLAPCADDTVDAIRVVIWKTKHTPDGREVDALQEGFDYCKGIVERGYKLCVQPARVDQYTDEEFIAMVRQFSTLNPMALYVVDSWGTQYTHQLLHYMKLADQNLPKNVGLGYHGHNNMMHAFAVAEQMLSMPFERDIIIDASVYGIGRGAGNLNTELIAKYMNETLGRNYQISPMIDVFDRYLKDIFARTPWGFSLGFFMTACYNCNPNYASYYEQELKLPSAQLNQLLATLSPEDKVIYSKAKADWYLKEYQGK